MKRQFKVNGCYMEDMLTAIYLQFIDDFCDKCRLLESRYNAAGHSYTYTPLKARKIHETRSGEYYILLRGCRVFLDEFLRPGNDPINAAPCSILY